MSLYRVLGDVRWWGLSCVIGQVVGGVIMENL